ncbi:MAG: MarR family transcriptional regulator [Bacteroidales bacterium]|nr:MarR family transcriptional regulator [Bacteroidales bacterium]
MTGDALFDERLDFQLYTASRLLQQVCQSRLGERGLTYTQYLVLRVLWERDNQGAGDIGQRLGLSGSTLTPVLQRLERGGWVARSHGMADERRLLVRLTKRGYRLKEQLGDLAEAMVSEAVGVEMGEAELSQLTALLGRLNGLLSRR